MQPDLRRKAPRKTYHGQAGVMFNGHMCISRCTQIGEGGVLLRLDPLLETAQVGDIMVVTLFLPQIGGIVARSRCVYLTDDTKMGLQFEAIETKYKVRIREFVSRQKNSAEF